MASSLSNLVNNLSEGIRRIKCKFGHDDKKCENFFSTQFSSVLYKNRLIFYAQKLYDLLCSKMFISYHGTIIRTGITCKKISL